MNITAAIRPATEKLSKSGVAEAHREAKSLLAFAIEKDGSFLIAHPEYQLTDKEMIRFEQCIVRRANREPFQYITGRQEFFRLNFEVTPDVLIPRPETEVLVEAAIELLTGRSDRRFCEIGVGSGCISISILHTLPNVTAVAVDISETALNVARANADRHKVSDRLKLIPSDVFDRLREEEFDLIVSNPPYIPADVMPGLQAEVRDFEPSVALAGGSDGLSIIRRIVRESPDRLKDNGCLLVEIGFGQSESVRALFPAETWGVVESLLDLQGVPRIVKARKMPISGDKR